MGSVYHQQATEVLADMADKGLDADTFVAYLNDRFLGWQGDFIATKGYLDGHHHTSLIVSRCLHDSLPAPYNAVRYQMEQAHGFTAALAYVQLPTTTAKQVDDVVDAAAAECARVAAD